MGEDVKLTDPGTRFLTGTTSKTNTDCKDPDCKPNPFTTTTKPTSNCLDLYDPLTCKTMNSYPTSKPTTPPLPPTTPPLPPTTPPLPPPGSEEGVIEQATTPTTAVETTEAGESCVMSLTTLTSHQGIPSGEGCRSMNAGYISCSIHCFTAPQCKLVYGFCDGNGLCTCTYCLRLIDISQSFNGFEFYLHTKEMKVENSNRIDLPGGLAPGQVLVLKVTLAWYKTALNFQTPKDVALESKFDFEHGFFLTNWKINSAWGPGNKTSPHFDFTDGQTISAVFLVTSTEFKLYFDNVLFQQFTHRLDPADITYFALTSSSPKATLISFRM
ncbi:hypothetical protein EGW08_009319 [Elysia chlorotica]|uniref:Galectin n=1 Tax=Elysia chlorotica TaxID=188477 RepID=A0A3S1BFR4_ELYCH|nr:hypothetical protein EGW08_009319 [Elysia chlorotica]